MTLAGSICTRRLQEPVGDIASGPAFPINPETGEAAISAKTGKAFTITPGLLAARRSRVSRFSAAQTVLLE